MSLETVGAATFHKLLFFTKEMFDERLMVQCM
jgi:hypothetical protein